MSVIQSLEMDWLQAELAAVNAMLAALGDGEDPIGVMQFEYRRRELEEKITRLGSARETDD